MRGIGVGLVIAVCSVVYPAVGFSQRAPDLTRPAGKEWLTIGGDWHNTRYSALTQINRSNVKNLKGAWVTHLGSGLGQKYSFEGTPIVKDSILYIATGNDDVFALDGKTLRRQQPDRPWQGKLFPERHGFLTPAKNGQEPPNDQSFYATASYSLAKASS